MCVTMSWSVSLYRLARHDMHAHAHAAVCMLPIWFLLIRVPVIPLLLPLVLSVSLSVR